ncbi:uncharacterized protein LOC135844387 isoform X8 [Planococcus citri]|uniref:uncharacterized protein LOC135844387 isoform X8 n=1 Tax=Planococcus citri TaxID=170843 RepID=UPI0031F98A2E
MDSSNDTSDQVASKPTPEEVDTPKEDNTISDPLSMGNSKDDSAQSTPKPCSETEVNTETNAVGAVDDATCKHPRDDEQCSPASKRSKSSDEGASDTVTSPSTRSRVVVFDIDGTLCRNSIWKETEEIIRKSFPECPIIDWNQHYSDGSIGRTPYVFLPHLNILFEYLLEQGVRIVFFSSAIKERNLAVIPGLLKSFWGSEKFEALKAEGQFEILSQDHLRKGRTAPGEGNYVKDLKVVVRDGETLLDAILVEDDYTFAAHDQKPYLYIIDITFWYIRDKDEAEKEDKRYGHWVEKTSNFCLNSIYYMLGVFKTYFGHEKYKVLPLREGLNQLLPKEAHGNSCDFFAKHSFADDMINLGLSEVQKLVPDAMYY